MQCSDALSLASLVNKRQCIEKKEDIDNPDFLFGKTCEKMIGDITDPMTKEMAKIEVQQFLVRYRFQLAIQRPFPPSMGMSQPTSHPVPIDRCLVTKYDTYIQRTPVQQHFSMSMQQMKQLREGKVSLPINRQAHYVFDETFMFIP